MKTTIVTIALCLGLSYANAQHLKDAEVPANVKDAFAKKYPGSKVNVWEKEGADYEAEFDLKKVESSAIFDSKGSFKALEQEIESSSLPQAAVAYCAKMFPGYTLAEAEKTTAANGKITFEAEMEKGKEHFDALFDDKGNFLKKSETSTKKEGKD